MWFKIKVAHRFTECPRNILYQLRLLKLESSEVVNIVKQVQHSAWYAFSESIIQTMVCSGNVEERIGSIDLIVKIRSPGGKKLQFGDKNVRARETPEINPDATTLKQLID